MTMYTVDIHSCPGYAFRLSERSFRLFIRRPVYRSVRSASDKGVRLEFGNYPTLRFSSLTGDFVPLIGNP